MLDDLRSLLFKSEVSKAISSYEREHLEIAFELLKHRFGVYAGWEGYESKVGYDDFSGSYPTLDEAMAVAVTDLEEHDDDEDRAAAIIDRATDTEVWNSDEWRAEKTKKSWKYNSLADLDAAGMVNHDQYLILEQLPWDAYKNEVNVPYPRLGVANFLKHWSELQRMIVEFQANPAFCQELKDAVRDGKITLQKAYEFEEVPLEEQKHPVDILVHGGNVILHGFKKPAGVNWRFDLWQQETNTYADNLHFSDWKSCQLIWRLPRTEDPKGVVLGNFKNGDFGRVILEKVDRTETLNDAIIELLRWPEFVPICPREEFNASYIESAIKKH